MNRFRMNPSLQEMKPDWTYIDGDDGIEIFIERAIAELDHLIREKLVYEERFAFEQYSYTKFALKTMLSAIKKYRGLHPISIVRAFANRMDRYAYENAETSEIFSTARDTAQAILYQLDSPQQVNELFLEGGNRYE